MSSCRHSATDHRTSARHPASVASGLALALSGTVALTACADGGELPGFQEEAGLDAAVPDSGATASRRLIDDFESGQLVGWELWPSAADSWRVFSLMDAGRPSAPEPVSVALPKGLHGQGYAAPSGRGTGARILARELGLDAAYALELTLFYMTPEPFSPPGVLTSARSDPSQQIRVEVLAAEAPIDSVDPAHVLTTVFVTSPELALGCGPLTLRHDLSAWQGRRVRLRVAVADVTDPILAAIDDVQLVAVTEGQTPPAPAAVCGRLTESEAVADVRAQAEQLAASDAFSGALLVARDDEVLLESAHGLADRDAALPASPSTRFRIGSMNKMFTSVAILQLVEQGKVELDAPVGRYVGPPLNPQIAAQVTIRQLLSHTGGTGDIFGPEFAAQRLSLREHEDYLAAFGPRAPTHAAGAAFRYSNFGFILLGVVIERVTGASYYDYERTHVFGPAGMTATDSLPENEAIPDLATGYMRDGARWVDNAPTLPWRGTAAGGGYSTVRDLLRFARALEAGLLLQRATLEQATTPGAGQYGFGFTMQGRGALRSYGHGGGAPGINGKLSVYPELGYVVVGLSNLDPPAAQRVVEHFTGRMPATARTTTAP